MPDGPWMDFAPAPDGPWSDFAKPQPFDPAQPYPKATAEPPITTVDDYGRPVGRSLPEVDTNQPLPRGNMGDGRPYQGGMDFNLPGGPRTFTPDGIRVPGQTYNRALGAAGLQGGASGVAAIVRAPGEFAPVAAAAEDTLRGIALIDQDKAGPEMYQGMSNIARGQVANYIRATPEQRVQIKADLTAQAAQAGQPNAMTRAGDAIDAAAQREFAVDQGQEGFGTKAMRMFGSAVPALGAGMVAGPEAGLAVFGLQAYDGTTKEATAKGATPRQAAQAATVSSLASMGIFALPFGQAARSVVPELSSGVLQAILEAGAKSAEFSVASATSKAVDNAITQRAYNPDQPLMEGVLEAGLAGAGMGAVFGAPGVARAVHAAANDARLPLNDPGLHGAYTTQQNEAAEAQRLIGTDQPPGTPPEAAPVAPVAPKPTPPVAPTGQEVAPVAAPTPPITTPAPPPVVPPEAPRPPIAATAPPVAVPPNPHQVLSNISQGKPPETPVAAPPTPVPVAAPAPPVAATPPPAAPPQESKPPASVESPLPAVPPQESTPAPVESKPAAPANPFEMQPIGSRQAPDENYLGPLSDHTPVVFREAAPAEAKFFLPGRAAIDMHTSEPFFSDNSATALGQGENKGGIQLAFDTANLRGVVSRTKPAWQFMYQNGAAEYVGRHNTQAAYQGALAGVRVPNSLDLSRGDGNQVRFGLQELLRRGWTKQDLGNGYTEFLPGEAREGVPPPAITQNPAPESAITPSTIAQPPPDYTPPGSVDFADQVQQWKTAHGPDGAMARVVEQALNDRDRMGPTEDKTIRMNALQGVAEQLVYGGKLGEGAFGRDRLYDAIELGVNRYILGHPERFAPTGDLEHAKAAADALAEIKQRLPTQTVRTGDKDKLQQFSTPPDYSFAAAWAANLRPTDHVLEPSAGNGGLITHALTAGVAQTHANEISPQRFGNLADLPITALSRENAEQLHNILPRHIRPTVVLMNPPFSSSGDRMGGKMDTTIGAQHIDQALARLEPGGRLVAIVGGGRPGPRGGEGMAMTAPSFKAWWAKTSANYDVRADIGVGGAIYGKYGTTFPTRLLVIDKVAPSGRPVIRNEVVKASEIIEALAKVRDDRPGGASQPIVSQPAGTQVVGPNQGADQSPAAIRHPIGDLGTGGGGDHHPGPAGTLATDAGGGEAAGVQPPAIGPETGTAGDAGALGQSEPVDGGPVQQPGTGVVAGQDTSEGSGSGGGGHIRPDGSDSAVTPLNPELVEAGIVIPDVQHGGELTESVYEDYKPQRISIEGARPHPGALVQSAAMASVLPPVPSYKPAIPQALIKKGGLSDAQLEAIVYAGDAHARMLGEDDKGITKRRGFFIGDGTGVGKGREVAGIILDNWMQGRRKAVWVSDKMALANDAKRDWTGLGQDAASLIPHNKIKASDNIDAKQGILFTSYDTLRSGEKAKGVGGTEGAAKAGKSRVDQIVDWLGKDFDGVIAFDEAHNMANAIDTKGTRGKKEASQKALAGIELQNKLPNARVVYVSATGATEVNNLAYADRLGLWGRGTAFANMRDFLAKIGLGGVGAMELVARDMKALGQYTARNLSYDGVEYDRILHPLTDNQRDMYDKVAEAWQVVLQNFTKALEDTNSGGKGGVAAGVKSAFWGGHQRFFNQMITSLQMPSVIKGVEEDVKAGRQAVLQLVNTNEAGQERALNKAKAAGEDNLEELDMSPRDQLMQLVEKAFPTQQYEPYIDENGNERVRPVVDADGKPVHNQEALANKERLLDQLGSLRVPDGPLEILMNHFGPDAVAEVTGRKQRVVNKPDENGVLKKTLEKRSGDANIADAKAFQDGKKKILVFSEAGGTGRSYHADNTAPSSNSRRSHYLVQAGWRADKAVQGFGRTHRTNQASAPIFHLVTTDLEGQKRFISSIARRLGQLGALTKGERKTGDQGMFGLQDNLESDMAKAALEQLYRDAFYDRIEGVGEAMFADQMGLSLRDPTTNGLRADLPPMTQFLNRLLSLKSADQNMMFNAFSERFAAIIQRATETGTLDAGTETYRADKITKKSDQVVYTDQQSGAETRHVHLETHERNHPVPFDTVSSGQSFLTHSRPPLFYVQNVRSGRISAVADSNYAPTDPDGVTTEHYRVANPLTGTYQAKHDIDTAPAEQLRRITDPTEARQLWDAQVAATPAFKTSDLHMITGAVLPIWDRLRGKPKVYRLQTDDGERMLGRVVDNRSINDTLKRLGAQGAKITATPAQVVQKVLDGSTVTLANGWTIKRSMVAGQWRMELKGDDLYSAMGQLERDGVFRERIAYDTRYFIPTGDKAAEVIARITAARPITELTSTSDDSQYAMRLPLYSMVSRAVDALKQLKGTGEQMLAQISRTPGVKPEEIKWLGLEDWLKDQKGVTKAQIQDYVRANALDVREVTKGGEPEPDRGNGWTTVGGGDQTKFGQYALPGGANYREMLITLPPKTRPWEVFHPTDGHPVASFDTEAEAMADARRRGGGFDYGRSDAPDNPAAYRSSHWDEPNVVAHTRFSERTAPDGAKVLHIEELQSDWHQAGRKQGYKDGAAKPLDELYDVKRHVVNGETVWSAYDRETGQLAGRGASLPEMEKEVREAMTFEDTPIARLNAVPDAPFKTTWPMLAMKRMVQYAVDHGFDRVAWNPGDVQAARYDLSKHLDRIEYEPSDEAGKYEIAAYDKAGKEVIHEDEVGLDRIEQMVGKELAQKIADDVGEPMKDRPLRDWRSLSGLDLKVGGEGMKGFYDKMLPNEVQKLIGKFGARVGQGEIEHPAPDYGDGERRDAMRQPVHSFDITDQLRRAVQEDGLPLFAKRIPSEAEAARIAAIPGELPQAAKAARERFYQAASAMMRFAGLPESVGLKLVDKITEANADAKYARGLITFGLDTDAEKAPFKIWHETLHALMSPTLGLLSPKERLAMFAGADRWLKADPKRAESLKADGYGGNELRDEAVAKMAEQALARGLQPNTVIGTAIGKLRNVGRGLGQFFRGEGWTTAEDVFNGLMRGDRAQPGAREAMRAADMAQAAQSRPSAGPISAAQAPAQKPEDPTEPVASPEVQKTTANAQDYTVAGTTITLPDRYFSRRTPVALQNAAPTSVIARTAIKVDDWREKMSDAISHTLSPMTMGSKQAQAYAFRFANALRSIQYQFGQIDRHIVKQFDPAARDAMGRAMDDQSVLEQQINQLRKQNAAPAQGTIGQTTPPQTPMTAVQLAGTELQMRQALEVQGRGVASLPADQRRVVEDLAAMAETVWGRMRSRGLVPPGAEGLPFYMARQIVMRDPDNTITRPGSGAGRDINEIGRNLSTAGPQRRQHLTPEETEAAAKIKLGQSAELIRDIRSVVQRLASNERSIAGTDLINQIERVGQAAGVSLVVRGAIPGLLNPADYFTINHPSMQRYVGAGFEALHIAREFEGPLNAVLTTKTGDLYNALMKAKGGVMHAIMFSPFMHLAVELGRALPLMPGKILSGRVMVSGARLKADPAFMNTAIREGLSPIGQGWSLDPVRVAEEADTSGRSGFVSAMIAARDKAAEAVSKLATPFGQKAVDWTADALKHPSQTILWDQVFNLQVGLYSEMRSRFMAKGFAPDVAGVMASHIANRYAGALPPENLSKLTNQAANMLAFSRSFTLGNLGVMKDMLNGAPQHIRATIEQMASPAVAGQAQAALQRKAQAAFILDIGFSVLGTALFQQMAAIAIRAPAMGLPAAAQQVWDDWLDQTKASFSQINENPLNVLGFLPQFHNEPGKKNRIYVGNDSAGRGTYVRPAFGKVGEEFLGWYTHPGEMVMNKMSPFARPVVEAIFGEDSLGRKITKPNPTTAGDYMKNAGRVVMHFLGAQGPWDHLGGTWDLLTGQSKGDRGVAAVKALLPFTGLGTMSSGYPGGPDNGRIAAAKKDVAFETQRTIPQAAKLAQSGDVPGAMKLLTDAGDDPREAARMAMFLANPAVGQASAARWAARHPGAMAP